MSNVLEHSLQDIAARLESLKPAVEEYSRLQAASEVLASLNGTPKRSKNVYPTSAAKGRSRSRRLGKTRSRPAPRVGTDRARTGRHKSAGTRRRGRPKGWSTRPGEALAAIQAQPGITTAGIAAKLKMRPNYLYRVLPVLQKERRIRKEGKGWHPTGSS
jgi:hypothetical protein